MAPTSPESFRRYARHAARDAAIAAAIAAAAAFAVNALRPGGLPVVQREPYQLVVPCPDATGEVGELQAADARLRDGGTLLVDARSASEFEAWHVPGARNVPYDFLDAVPASAVAEIANSGARLVAVYGDGADPDSGRELAREIAGKGIRNVHAVRGGAAALRAEVKP